MILREVISDMFSKRLAHIREALHEGDALVGISWTQTIEGVNNSWIKRAIPWLCRFW